MNRVFERSGIDPVTTVVTMSLYDKPSECLALFSCTFKHMDVVTFHVDSFRPYAFNLPREFDTFFTRALRIIRDGLSSDDASILEL